MQRASPFDSAASLGRRRPGSRGRERAAGSRDGPPPGGTSAGGGVDERDEGLRAALDWLRKQPDARYAEVRFMEEANERFRVRDGRTEQAMAGSSRGVGIRVLGVKAWGFACTAHPTESALVEAAGRALAIARASGLVARDPIAFPQRAAARGHYETAVAIDPFTIPIETKLAVLDDPVRALRLGDPRLVSAEAWMHWTRQTKRLLTTEGTDVTQSFTYGACGMHVFALGDDGVSQRRSYPTWQGGDGFQAGWERIAALDLNAHVDHTRDEALALLTAPACPAGTRTLLVESSQLGLQIHESCGHPTELDRALGSEISLAGGSFLQPSMLGKLRYGSPLVTLVADSTTPGGNGTFGWDDEGTPAGKRPLVDRGLFVDYLSSRETAAALGRPSTGTMRADSWNRTPIIRMVNVSLEPGSAGSLEDLVADTDDGILVATDKSWSIDDIRLNFQFSCEIAWEIKRGRRVRLLRDPFYTGITPRFWNACDAVCGADAWKLWGITSCGKGDPMQVMHVGHGAAPARFRDVTVGSAS
jgi:TldD protein